RRSVLGSNGRDIIQMVDGDGFVFPNRNRQRPYRLALVVYVVHAFLLSDLCCGRNFRFGLEHAQFRLVQSLSITPADSRSEMRSVVRILMLSPARTRASAACGNGCTQG